MSVAPRSSAGGTGRADRPAQSHWAMKREAGRKPGRLPSPVAERAAESLRPAAHWLRLRRDLIDLTNEASN
jgi:hypothetical protein